MALSLAESIMFFKNEYLETANNVPVGNQTPVVVADTIVGNWDDWGDPIVYTNDAGAEVPAYPVYAEYKDATLSIIDEKRNILINEEQDLNFTQESNAQYIPFEMPRYWDGIDLTQMVLTIYPVNPNGETILMDDIMGVIPINVRYGLNDSGKEVIRFHWLLDSRVTQVAGEVKFEIHAVGVIKNSKGESEPYIWKSRPAKGITISQALVNTGKAIEVDPSWMETLTGQFTNAVTVTTQNATTASDAARSANETLVKVEKLVERMDDYLTGDTVDSATILGNIQTNREDISKLKGEVSINSSDIEILSGDQAALEERIEVVEDFFKTTDDVTETTIDTLKEIQKYIDEDMKDATELIARMNAVTATANEAKQAAADEKTRATLAEGELDSRLNTLSDSVSSLPETLQTDYYTKTDIDTTLGRYATNADVNDKISKIDGLAAFSATYSTVEGKHLLTFYNGEEVMGEPLEIPNENYLSVIQEEISKIDSLSELRAESVKQDASEEQEAGNWLYFYNGDAVEGEDRVLITSCFIPVPEIDLSNYYDKGEIDTKLSSLDIADQLGDYAKQSDVSNNTNAIAALRSTVDSIDKTPKTTYRATYGDVELDDGSTAEYMFTLWKKEGNNDEEVQDRFQIAGGGGGGSSTTLRIAYIDGYGTPLIATTDNKDDGQVIIKYRFTGEDSGGDTNLSATASWKVGNRVVATEEVTTNSPDDLEDVLEFNISEYVSTGDNKVLLTITHTTGAIATKAWTVRIVDIRLESGFDDTRTYPANEPVTFTFTPYGAVEKTVHFLLDGEEIGTKSSSASGSGLSDSFTIPAQEHGAHLFELYMTTVLNNQTVESNRIKKDILWYDETLGQPIIGTISQNFTARQYEATNITYTVHDPSTETPKVKLAASYVNEEGETVQETESEITMSANTAIWQYKTDVLGEHTLTITAGDAEKGTEVVKTLTANVVPLGIDVAPITAGIAFDFNPSGYSNDDANRLWAEKTNPEIKMSVSDNFDWINGGYQLDENGDQYFCIKAGTSAEINYELFGDDAKTNGKQFKLVFMTENVADGETVFLECCSDTGAMDESGRLDKVGIEMLAHEATIYAKTEELPLPYSEEEIIEFEFNITPYTETVAVGATPPMVMGYEDGVSTRPLVYNTSHDFQQVMGQRKTISLGSPDCDLRIYRFKVYKNSLSDRDILNNFIADARSAEEMIARYDRNQIYQNGLLTPEGLAEACPQLRIIKIEAPRFTYDKDDKVGNTTVECIYKNGDPVLDNWIAYHAAHSGQGTSSNNYGPSGRNLDLILKKYKKLTYTEDPYIVLGDGETVVKKVSLTRNSVDTNYFNVKVNIASSENANNALLAKRYNTYNPYKRPFVREDETEIPKIKDTMEFCNCVIFIKESDPDLTTHTEFGDNEWHFYAIGNMGDSKKTDDTRLTDPSDPYECILEVMDNTLPNSTMPTGKVDENGAPIYPIDPSEWTTGNVAYDDLMAETFDEAKAADKADSNGKADTYGWRYIYEDGSDEENAAAKAYVEGKWREFYEFVVTSTDEEFKAHLGDYCVLDSFFYYYLFTLRYTMTDNHAKNSFWHYGKSNDLDSDGQPIRKWDLSFDYDNDTALGIDNYGRMSYRYGYEEIDYVDGTSDWVWNAPQHVLFLRIRELFHEELSELYRKLETDGCWSATGLINQFNEWQMEWPEELWRLDIQRKYIRTYTSSYWPGVGNGLSPAGRPEYLTERANGRKKTQRAQFERNQEKYMSSKFAGNVAAADDIILRCSVPNTQLAVPANFDMHLTPYSYIYLNVKYNTTAPQPIRAVPGQEYTIKYDADLADIIEIYSASCLKSIGDLSACYLTNGDFANASKITELTLGSNVEGYNNTNAMTLKLGSNDLLRTLNIENMSGLTHPLDASGLKNLESLYAYGSNVGGVIFAPGGNISYAELPGIGSLEMKDLSYLEDEGLKINTFNKLSKIIAENSVLDLVSLIEKSPNLYQVRLTGLNWNLYTSDLLARLYKLAGISNTGANLDQSVLAGYVHIPTVKQHALAQYVAAWPDLIIEADYVQEQYTVRFFNDDGTLLETQSVDRAGYIVDPATRAENPLLPTKESTVSTDYTFKGWDTNFAKEPVYNDMDIYATYSEALRKYTVQYVSKGLILETHTDQEYGTIVSYGGSTPTYTDLEGEKIYSLFKGWDQTGYVDGDKTINALFDTYNYSPQSLTGKKLEELTPVQLYAVTKLNEAYNALNPQAGDVYPLYVGNDVDFGGVELVNVDNPIKLTGSYYELAQINGENVYLFDEDKDFTLTIDYTANQILDGSNKQKASVVAQCCTLGGGGMVAKGFQIRCNANATDGFKTYFGPNTSASTSNAGDREIVIIRHKKGESKLDVFSSKLNSLAPQQVTLSDDTFNFSNVPLVFGVAYHPEENVEWSNDPGYAQGAIHWSKLWDSALSDDICLELAMWPHEVLQLEFDAKGRYVVSDTGKFTTMTFASDTLLNRSFAFGAPDWQTDPENDATAPRAWKVSLLRKILNQRFYEALPLQFRSLVKAASIPTAYSKNSYWNEASSEELVDHITIPSLTELGLASQSQLTLTEGAQLSVFTNNTSRLKKKSEAEIPSSYWTRTPFLGTGGNFSVQRVFSALQEDSNFSWATPGQTAISQSCIGSNAYAVLVILSI